MSMMLQHGDQFKPESVTRRRARKALPFLAVLLFGFAAGQVTAGKGSKALNKLDTQNINLEFRNPEGPGYIKTELEIFRITDDQGNNREIEGTGKNGSNWGQYKIKWGNLTYMTVPVKMEVTKPQ